MREAMDNFIDSFLSSPSWSDVNASRSWVGSIVSQTDSLLADSMASYQRDVKNSAMPVMPSSHIMRDVSTEDLNIAHDNPSSMFNNGSSKYGLSKGLFLAGNDSKSEKPNYNSQPSHGIDAHDWSCSKPDTVSCNSDTVSYGHELNASLPYSALTISSSLESNGSEPSNFGQSIREAHSISSVPTIWPSSYTGISSLTGQEKVENFGFQGMENAADLLQKSRNELGPNLVTFASGQQIKMNSANSQPHNQVATGVANLELPSFSRSLQMPFSKTSGMQTNEQSEEIAFKHQLSHSSSTYQQMPQANAAVCNVAAKPRVRARRGQATDPHSIAERLRREKIAERMKNLQELVPNSNKTDKASMLDEIIDYVKFLQLQVKVLSMSRLGAAGAVVPLITDVQAEDTRSLHLSPISREDLYESQDDLAFEQEVVKLMESNVTTAMQYLQNKGLCLMPIALASAISNNKDSAADLRTQDAGERIVTVKQEELTKSMGDES